MIFLADKRLVTLSEEVTSKIQKFTQPPETEKEAGGILLGTHRGPHVEVVQCTTPMAEDKRSRFSFVRLDPGHQRAAITAWKASGQTVHFIGEWHTHPETHPTPSNIDQNTWVDLMRRRRKEALVFLIAGFEEFYCDLGEDNRLINMKTVS